MIVTMSRMWSVRYTLPAIKGNTGERRYTKNGSATCICDSLEQAHAMFRSTHPDAVVWQINHKGADEYYYDKVQHAVLLTEARTT